MKAAGARKSADRVTLRDIAGESGVTPATVSDILNERERCWASKETKERVRAAAERLGYRVNRAARLLRTGNSGLIGIIVSDILNPFYVSLAHSLEASLETAGYEVVIEDCSGDPAREGRAIQNLLALSVDGMICATMFSEKNIATLQEYAQSGRRLVFVGTPPKELDVRSVRVADDEAFADLAELLRDRGHERIAYVSAQPQALKDRDREGRLRRALEAVKLTLDADLVVECPPALDDIARAVRELCERPVRKRPTVICAVNDLTAIAIVRAILDAGLEFPRDISVVGFDDIDLARWLPCRLTTISQDYARIADESVRLLAEEGEVGKAARSAVVTGRLMIRDSVVAVGLGTV